jgi:hypothetical protein
MSNKIAAGADSLDTEQLMDGFVRAISATNKLWIGGG